jgi:hypothetical protein
VFTLAWTIFGQPDVALVRAQHAHVEQALEPEGRPGTLRARETSGGSTATAEMPPDLVPCCHGRAAAGR